MTDLRNAFRGFDRMPTPDVWEEAEERGSRPGTFESSGTVLRRKLAVMIVAFGATSLSLFLILAMLAGPETGDEIGSPSRPSGTLAFESSGDIFVVDGETARVDELLDRDPADSEASLAFTWSPDGSMVAYTDPDSEGRLRLYVAASDGSGAHAITPPSLRPDSPSWSPDGARIVFSAASGGVSDIYVASPAGDELEQLTSQRANGVDGAYMPAWSPRGSTIAYVWIQYDGASQTERQTIAVIEAAGGAAETLTQGPLDESPAWSPDGEHLAFVRKSGDGPALHRVAVPDRIEEVIGPLTTLGGFEWSSDGSLAFVDARTGGISVSAPDGAIREVVSAAELGDGEVVGAPTWSPDGQWLTFAARQARSESRIFAFFETSGVLVTLTPQEHVAFGPLWRPA
jgi:Tol biopolymer transport system component